MLIRTARGMSRYVTEHETPTSRVKKCVIAMVRGMCGMLRDVFPTPYIRARVIMIMQLASRGTNLRKHTAIIRTSREAFSRNGLLLRDVG